MFKNKIIPTVFTLMLFGLISIASVNKNNIHQDTSSADYVQLQNVLLSGEVVDANTKEALADVTVKVSELNVSATTNADGEFTIKNLEAGETYTLVVEHDGYKKYENEVEIEAQSPEVNKTLKLEPEDS